MSGALASLNGYFSSISFVLKHGMGWMFLVPAVLWALLAFGMFAVLTGPVEDLTVWAGTYMDLDMELEGEGFFSDLVAFMRGARDFLLAWLLRFAIAYLLFTFNKYIVLILLSPLFAYASERTEEIISGRAYPFSAMRLMNEALRGALIAIRNGVLEILITIGFWVFTLFFPPIAPVTVIVLFVVSAYFYGFSMFDYIFERRRMRVADSVKATNERIPMVLVNGTLFSLVMKIPLVGMMFGPVMASVGAVLAMKGDPLLQPQAGVGLERV